MGLGGWRIEGFGRGLEGGGVESAEARGMGVGNRGGRSDGSAQRVGNGAVAGTQTIGVVGEIVRGGGRRRHGLVLEIKIRLGRGDGRLIAADRRTETATGTATGIMTRGGGGTVIVTGGDDSSTAGLRRELCTWAFIALASRIGGDRSTKKALVPDRIHQVLLC